MEAEVVKATAVMVMEMVAAMVLVMRGITNGNANNSFR
jgi:hypothetical protein